MGKPIVDKSYRYDKNTHSVKGNLILDENTFAQVNKKTPEFAFGVFYVILIQIF